MCLPVVEQHDSGQLEQRVMSGVGSNEGVDFSTETSRGPRKKSKKGRDIAPCRMGIQWGKGSKAASPFPTCQVLPSV